MVVYRYFSDHRCYYFNRYSLLFATDVWNYYTRLLFRYFARWHLVVISIVSVQYVRLHARTFTGLDDNRTINRRIRILRRTPPVRFGFNYVSIAIGIHRDVFPSPITRWHCPKKGGDPRHEVDYWWGTEIQNPRGDHSLSLLIAVPFVQLFPPSTPPFFPFQIVIFLVLGSSSSPRTIPPLTFNSHPASIACMHVRTYVCSYHSLESLGGNSTLVYRRFIDVYRMSSF